MLYPVIFTQTEDNIITEVPDLCVYSDGLDEEDAIENIKEVIEILFNDESWKEPSNDITIKDATFAKYGTSYIKYIDL